MYYSQLVKTACSILFQAHRDDLDKGGYPYVFHPFYLATQMDDEASTCVALLHDVIEDHGDMYSFADLERAGFPVPVLDALRLLTHTEGAPFEVVAKTIKNTAFMITRLGQLVAEAATERLHAPFGIIDLSLAPTSAVGDSVAAVLEEMGLESCGGPGTTAALALLNDAVKKGGLMASSSVGGLSGAFIPVSEDLGMIEAVQRGSLCLEKLEAMTCVCSVGLDMIAVPGDTSASTLSAILADEAAIGMINNKTTATRLIPVPGKKPGDMVQFGGLMGYAPVMGISKFKADEFVARGGKIPAPLRSLTN